MVVYMCGYIYIYLNSCEFVNYPNSGRFLLYV